MALSKVDGTNFIAPTIPVASGGTGSTSLSGAGIATTNGITEADFWRTNSSQAISASTATVVSGNWERDDYYFDKIGTGMTESSGIFTFPSTGIWRIDYQQYAYGFGGDGATSARYLQAEIEATYDDGTFVDLAASDVPGDAIAGVKYVTQQTFTMFDVTDVSNYKARFKIYIEGQQGTLYGHTTTNYTMAAFTRLGDT